MRIEIERELARIIDAESKIGNRWWPGAEIAPIAYRRWSSFPRRHPETPPQIDLQIRDLAKGLQAHFEPEIPYTHVSDWLRLAEIIAQVFANTP
jgi:hypothetical protein